MSSDSGEQKPTIPIKSSMEILSELFSTFHAEPPLIIKKEKSEELNKKRKKSKKKHKHKDKKHKKKEKKKRKTTTSSSDDSEVDLAKILIKQEKEASEKKIRIEGTELTFDIKPKILKKEKDYEESEPDIVEKKVAIKSLDSIFESTIKEIRNKVKKKIHEDGEVSDSESSVSDRDVIESKKSKYKSSSKKRSHSSSSRDKSEKKIKRDDLRNKIKSDRKHKERSNSRNHSKEKDRYRDRSSEKDFYKVGNHSRTSDDRRSWDSNRDRTRDKQRDHKSRSTEKHKDPYGREIEDYKRQRNKDNSFYKDDGFYKSRNRESRDEKWYTKDRYEFYI